METIIFETDKSAIIWALYFDAESKMLLVESRSQQNLQMRLDVVDLNSFTIKAASVQPEASWFMGVHGICGDFILMYGRDPGDSPMPQSLLVWDWRKNELLWEKSDVQLLAFFQDKFLVSDKTNPDKTPFTVWAANGQMCPIGFSDVAIQSFHAYKEPNIYFEGTPYFETCALFLAKRINMQAVTQAEYLETGGKIILAYYVKDKLGLSNRLLVAAKDDGKVLWETELGAGLKGVSDKSFWIYENTLCCIRDKQSLLAISLL